MADTPTEMPYQITDGIYAGTPPPNMSTDTPVLLDMYDAKIESGTPTTATHSITLAKAETSVIGFYAEGINAVGLTQWMRDGFYFPAIFGFEVITGNADVTLVGISFSRRTTAGDSYLWWSFNVATIVMSAGPYLYIQNASTTTVNTASTDKLGVSLLFTNAAAHAASTFTVRITHTADARIQKYWNRTGVAAVSAGGILLPTPAESTRIFADGFTNGILNGSLESAAPSITGTSWNGTAGKGRRHPDIPGYMELGSP